MLFCAPQTSANPDLPWAKTFLGRNSSKTSFLESCSEDYGCYGYQINDVSAISKFTWSLIPTGGCGVPPYRINLGKPVQPPEIERAQNDLSCHGYFRLCSCIHGLQLCWMGQVIEKSQKLLFSEHLLFLNKSKAQNITGKDMNYKLHIGIPLGKYFLVILWRDLVHFWPALLPAQLNGRFRDKHVWARMIPRETCFWQKDSFKFQLVLKQIGCTRTACGKAAWRTGDLEL